MSVGTGKDVEHGMLQSIKSHNPDRVIFICTEESKNTIQRIEEISRNEKVLLPGYEIRIIDGENINNAYSSIKGIIREIKDSYTNIIIDYTSGTKVMSAALALAGVSEEITSLSYVSGKRDKDTGRVISGTEEVRTLSPTTILSDIKFKIVRELFNSNEYRTCIDLLEKIKSGTREQEIIDLADKYLKLSKFYFYWDNFEYEKAEKMIDEIDNFLLDIDENKQFFEDKMKSRPEAKVVDLLSNIRRCLNKGRYFDAVLRLLTVKERLIGLESMLEDKIKSRINSDSELNTLLYKAKEFASGKSDMKEEEIRQLFNKFSTHAAEIIKDFKEFEKCTNFPSFK
ncbi:MAG: TIGR02710 family CRISPR-associated CARF protein [Candidatus Korarchaeota archaeon]